MWRRPLEWNLNGTTEPRDGSVDHLSPNSLKDRHGPIRAPKSPAASSPGEALTAWAMRWFTEMMAGRTDRSQYAPAFAPQVTDEAVARISHDLNRYGAAPLRAEIVQTKKDGEQTFTVLKFVFPRGDATSLLFGFDAAGKVTGIAVGGLAGD